MRQVETSFYSPGLFVCGVQPEPTEERLDLRQNHHPGFGGITLYCDGDFVWSPNRYEDSRTLGWIERKLITKEGNWTLDIDGPMVSYILERRGPKYWVLKSSEVGFA